MANPVYDGRSGGLLAQPNHTPTAYAGRLQFRCGKPVGSDAAQRASLRDIKRAREVLQRRGNGSPRNEAAIADVRRLLVGPLAMAVALNTADDVVRNNPGRLLNEIAVNLDFRQWLDVAVRDPEGATRRSLTELAGTLRNVTPSLMPLIEPLVADLQAGRNRTMHGLRLEAATFPAFRAFMGAMIVQLVVVPLLGLPAAQQVAAAAMQGGWGVGLLDIEHDNCCCECDWGCNCDNISLSCVIS